MKIKYNQQKERMSNDTQKNGDTYNFKMKQIIIVTLEVTERRKKKQKIYNTNKIL